MRHVLWPVQYPTAAHFGALEPMGRRSMCASRRLDRAMGRRNDGTFPGGSHLIVTQGRAVADAWRATYPADYWPLPDDCAWWRPRVLLPTQDLGTPTRRGVGGAGTRESRASLRGG